MILSVQLKHIDFLEEQINELSAEIVLEIPLKL